MEVSSTNQHYFFSNFELRRFFMFHQDLDDCYTHDRLNLVLLAVYVAWHQHVNTCSVPAFLYCALECRR